MTYRLWSSLSNMTAYERKVQESSSCALYEARSQLVFKEVGSNARKGMDFLVRIRREYYNFKRAAFNGCLPTTN